MVLTKDIKNSSLNIKLRMGKPEDSEQIRKLLIKGFNLNDYQLYNSYIRKELLNTTTFVVEVEGRILGYICGSYINDYEEFLTIIGYDSNVENNILNELSKSKTNVTELMEIRNLIVSEELRGLGYGSKLVKEILDVTGRDKYLVVGLERTKTGKWGAETIMKKEGFHLLGKVENMWLEDSKEDKQQCDLCIKPEGYDLNYGCYCLGSVWLHNN